MSRTNLVERNRRTIKEKRQRLSKYVLTTWAPIGGFGGSMGGVGGTGKAKRPIGVKFEIPYFTTSGIQVRYLKIIEPKVSNLIVLS